MQDQEAASADSAAQNNQVSGPNAIDGGGLIPANLQHQMHHDAHAEPTSNVAEIQRSPDIPVQVAPAKKHSAFNTMKMRTMFTLNLSNPLFFDSKEALSDIDIGEGEHLNLYSPFRRAKKMNNQQVAPEGVLRSILPSVFETTDLLNSSKLVYAGHADDVAETLASSIASTRNSIELQLPLSEDTLIVKRSLDDTDELRDVKFSDLIRIVYWVNSPKEVPISNTTSMIHHASMLNFIINSGAFYDSPNRAKYVKSVVSMLNMMATFRGEDANTDVLLGISFSSAFLSNDAFRAFLDELLIEQNFFLYSRQELYAHCGVIQNVDCLTSPEDWMPSSVADIDNCLMVPGTDILLVRLCDGSKDDAEESQ